VALSFLAVLFRARPHGREGFGLLQDGLYGVVFQIGCHSRLQDTARKLHSCLPGAVGSRYRLVGTFVRPHCQKYTTGAVGAPSESAGTIWRGRQVWRPDQQSEIADMMSAYHLFAGLARDA